MRPIHWVWPLLTVRRELTVCVLPSLFSSNPLLYHTKKFKRVKVFPHQISTNFVNRNQN